GSSGRELLPPGTCPTPCRADTFSRPRSFFRAVPHSPLRGKVAWFLQSPLLRPPGGRTIMPPGDSGDPSHRGAMVTPDLSFDQIMVRLRAGDEEAARRVFDHFPQPLIHLVRGRFNGLLRGREDPTDVAQSAFKSFFRGCAAGQFDLATWDDLWGLLAVITLR